VTSRRDKTIPEALYAKILDVMPIPCADAVLVSGKHFLLGKRNNRPAKGKWFLIGGRVQKGELLSDAIQRHIAREIGVKRMTIKKQLTTRETIFKDSAQGPASHSINTVFVVAIPYKKYVPPNDENAELAWFSKIDSRWHPYVKEALRLAGF